MTSPTDFDEIRLYIDTLGYEERKSLITLARAASFPGTSDTIIAEKVRPILAHIFVRYSDDQDDFDNLYLTRFGLLLQPYITSPMTTGGIIVLCLRYSPLVDHEKIRLASAMKEFSATQTVRKPSQWNWDLLFDNEDPDPTEVNNVHDDYPFLSPIQKRFRKSLAKCHQKYNGRRILPHYSSKGVSSETAAWILNRVGKSAYISPRTKRSSHIPVNASNITSKDVVRYYVASGEWPRGKVEMRQQWSPNLLSPRTYFAWGGEAVAVSTYLRNFFNDLADYLPSTHRFNRVQPDWLRNPYPDKPASYIFYDLTSFTSWYHEQVPILRSIARRFRHTMVDCVGWNLNAKTVSLGDLVDRYADVVNDFPEFYTKVVPYAERCERVGYYTHYTAGFLGVPGNLVTCTLGHGLTIASFHHRDNSVQTPGDDEGVRYRSSYEKVDIIRCAQTQGVLQESKLYDSNQLAVYLKRGVRVMREGVTLTDMLIYPIPTGIIPQRGFEYTHLSRIYRMPDAKDLNRRTSQLLVTWIRNTWILSAGGLDDFEEDFIHRFHEYYHELSNLPSSGIFQGQTVDGSDSEKVDIGQVRLKFPVDRRFLRYDPDVLFADSYITHMWTRSTRDLRIWSSFEAGLRSGSLITVRYNRKWGFLRDMGYIEEIQRTAGDKVLLLEDEARSAFLTGKKPPYSTFRVSADITPYQFASVGFPINDLDLQAGAFENVSGNPLEEGEILEDEHVRPIMRDWDRPTYGGIEIDYSSMGDLRRDYLDMGYDPDDIDFFIGLV